jgi:hypothetical protein
MTLKNICQSIVRTTMLGLLVIPTATIVSNAQQPEWQGAIDWAARNTDAGGSVDCPADYLSEVVGYAIASGGRAAVINAALFAASHQDFDQAYNLVLLTQCHNPNASQTLIDAGEKLVLLYLLNNYTPTGIDPQAVIGFVQTAIQALLAMQ